MKVSDLFDRRVRGFRVIEVGALTVLLVLALGVYLSKTGAGREGAETAKMQRQIDDERSRIRMLRAEVAYLEQPERIERLSTEFLGMQPTAAKREMEPDALVEVARDAAAAKADRTAKPAQVAVAAAPAATAATVASAPALRSGGAEEGR